MVEIKILDEKTSFHKKLKDKIHSFISLVYDLTEKFPKSELFSTTSQLRRASISIMLNYLEGFARFKPKVKVNFWETSYGSAKECKYLIFFALDRKWITKEEYEKTHALVDEIGAMLWKIINGLNKQIDSD